jgi:hypothetical protein
MAYQDDDRIRNPNDPWQREWNTGTAVTAIVAVLIMAVIVAYEASTTTETGVSSSISQRTGT